MQNIQKRGIKDSYKITANILGVDEEIFELANDNIGSNDTREVLEKYKQEMEKAKYDIDVNSYLIGLQTNPIASSGIGDLGIVVIIVMVIIVFTSVFCIKNSFDISITEKIRQYGMLRSIGATKKQIRKNVFYEATILGAIGIPLGILSGFFASYILIIVSNYYLHAMMESGVILEFCFSLVAVIVAIILGIITIYFSAFRSARRAAKVSPIESIRNSANIKINPKKVKSPKIIKKLFGIGGEISFKNLKRNKKKYRTTVISIVVSVSVFIALYSFMTMTFDEVKTEFKVTEYNISVNAREIDNDTYQKLLETTELDNIEDYSVIRGSGITYENPKYNPKYVEWVNLELNQASKSYLSFCTLGENQYKKYVKSLGLDYEKMKDKGILIDYMNTGRYNEEKDKYEHKYMRVYDYQVGDKIVGTTTKDYTIDGTNKTEENTTTLEIGYVTEEKPFGLKNTDGIRLIISDELFDKIATSNVVDIYYKSNNANKLQDDIEELLKDENYDLNNIEDNYRTMNNLFTLVGIFLYGFIIVISLIGITNIFNTITTSVELRKQEFAMLKSIGMTTKEFNRMVRLESIFMGVKSLIFGTTIGIGLSYLIYHFLSEESGNPYRLPVLAIILSICAVFILISLIMKYSIGKINKQNTIETIRNENI